MSQLAFALVALFALLGGPSLRSTLSKPPHVVVERAVPNDNRVAAGTRANGVHTIRLVARLAEWHPDGEGAPGVVVRAFAEEGKPAAVPAPLVRVPEGTEIRVVVRNALADSTLFVYGLSPRPSARAPEADTIQVAPGATREVRYVVGAAGTYHYWATTRPGALAARPVEDGALAGAFVVDPSPRSGPGGRGAAERARDRVFVLGLWGTGPRTPATPTTPAVPRVVRFTINGRAWPNTERLAYAQGDSVRFRLVNVSVAPHPMHLHGFFFDIGSRGDGTRDSTYAAGSPHMAVTERLAPGRTATLTWVPERAGYWLFHCHDNLHTLRNAPFDGTGRPPEHLMHARNHALEMMGGLVMGIEVKPVPTPARAIAVADRRATGRALRLVARVDPAPGSGQAPGGTLEEPAFGFVLDDGSGARATAPTLLPGPTIVLRRGQPVAITVVNDLPEATAVHWHGVELDSYYDGVAGFAGHPGHIAPVIAPGDSFVARFTPPRAGTFMYHPHADEVRQQRSGLTGALLVVDDPAAFDSTHDLVLLVTTPRRAVDAQTVFLNGTNAPPPRTLHVGETYRLRWLDLHTSRASMIMRLDAGGRDSTPPTWRAVAKDGMTLPPDQATMRPAAQQMGNGETYDFEFVPAAAGDLRLVVTASNGVVLVAMPLVVR